MLVSFASPRRGPVEAIRFQGNDVRASATLGYYEGDESWQFRIEFGQPPWKKEYEQQFDVGCETENNWRIEEGVQGVDIAIFPLTIKKCGTSTPDRKDSHCLRRLQ